ncbi:hypothetical protein B0J12DRAFT_688916 [Macrophomina phaseolina]|uniref:Secreted protein n=1 Tax=Macrophomina phaseolina TaxID=35725 RepID=A0ABQ8FRE9_9PEZI|nr:hypothetical protein B0J12DRAFT_688916 [Macrophomina phaseolina]
MAQCMTATLFFSFLSSFSPLVLFSFIYSIFPQRCGCSCCIINWIRSWSPNNRLPAVDTQRLPLTGAVSCRNFPYQWISLGHCNERRVMRHGSPTAGCSCLIATCQPKSPVLGNTPFLMSDFLALLPQASPLSRIFYPLGNNTP